MNANQKCVWKLLKELIDVCEEKEIPWFLSGRTAIRTYIKGTPFHKSFLDTEITIPVERAFDLITEIEKKNNRKLDSLLVNHMFPGFYMKYVDVDTTLVRMNEGCSTIYKGIFVKIMFLKHSPEEGCFKEDIIERLITETAPQGVIINKTTEASDRRDFEKKRKRKKTGFTKKVFADLIKAYDNVSSKTVLLNGLFKENLQDVKNDYYDHYFVLFQNYHLRLPGNPEKYFKLISDDQWEKYVDDIILESQEGTMILEGANNLVSSKVSYEKLLPVLEKNGLNASFYKKRIKSSIIANEQKELTQKPGTVWNMALRAGDIWNIHDRYNSKMEKLEGLFKASQINELEKEMELYDSTVKMYLSSDMAFYYTKDLHDIYIGFLKACGRVEEADRLEELLRSDEDLLKQLGLFYKALGKEDEKDGLDIFITNMGDEHE